MKGYDGGETRAELYPDSLKESKQVLKKMANPDLEYFEKSDKDLLKPFREYHETHGLDYDEKTLKQIAKHGYDIVMAHKKYYNRPRPAQVNPEIKPINTDTANTPAYPSGHAFQSFMLAKHLGKKYPQHKRKFYEMAHRIAASRVSVGLHYPSDNQKAFALAHSL